jgi:hypothetical protein
LAPILPFAFCTLHFAFAQRPDFFNTPRISDKC